MLPKLENKTQTGTIVYIVLIIINCSTYVYNIYTVYNRIKDMPAEYCAPTELVLGHRLVGTEHLSEAYSSASRIYVCILFLKTMLNRSVIVILWPICVLLKQIINHNRSKFVVNSFYRAFAVNISCIHACTVREHFLVCTLNVSLTTL